MRVHICSSCLVLIFSHCQISFESSAHLVCGLLRKHLCLRRYPIVLLTLFSTDVSARTLCIHQFESVFYSSRYHRRASLDLSQQPLRLWLALNQPTHICRSAYRNIRTVKQGEQGHLQRTVQTVPLCPHTQPLSAAFLKIH